MSVNVSGGGLNFDATIDGSQFQTQIRNIERDLNRLTEQTKKSGNDLDNLFKKAAVSAASFFSIQAAGDFVKSIVAVRGEFQQLEIAYRTILKSKEKGDALFAETVKLAATTPFSLQEVAQSTKQLLAYGFGAKEVTGVLTTLGNIAAGVSAPLGDIAYLYGTLKTQGRAYAMDIRQFTGRGIPIVAELAKQFGVTEKQVNNLVTAGKVGFPEVEKAFNSLTGSGGIFFNLMQEQSKTLTGQLSNLGDAFARMLNEIGKNNEGILNSAISSASKLVENYQNVLDIIELLVVTYGTYRAVLLVTAAVQAIIATGATTMTAAELLHYGALVLVQKAQLAWNSAAVQGAIASAAYTAVLVGIIVAIKSWTDATALAEKAQKSFNDIHTASVDKVTDEKSKIGELVAVIKDHNASQADRLLALKKLNQISPEFLGNLTLESVKTGEATKAIDGYLKALDRRVTGEAAYSAKLENNKKINELKSKGVDAISSTERAGLSLKQFFTGSGSAKSLISSDQGNKEIVDGLIAGYVKANKEIDALYKDQLREQITGNTNSNNKNIEAAIAFEKRLTDVVKNFNVLLSTQTGKKDLESIQKALNDALDVPNISDAQITKIKTQLTSVGDALKKYSVSNDKATAKAADSEFDKRKALYDQIGELQAQSLTDAKTADEKEVDQVKAKYKTILNAIDDYNKKAKIKIDPTNVKLRNGTVVNIPKTEKATEDDVVAKQDVEKLKVSIDQKKILFAEFESYKLQLGEKGATALYAADLNGFETYVKYLNSLMPKPEDLSAKANDMRDLLAKLIPAANKDELKKQSQQFIELILATQNYSEQRNGIIEDYNSKSATLRSKGYKQEADQFAKNTQDKLTELDLSNIQQLSAYKELYDGIEFLSTAKAQKDIDDLRAYVEGQKKAGTITAEAYVKATREINKLDTALKGRLPNDILAVSEGLTEMGNSFSDTNSGLAQLLTGLGAIGTRVANVNKLGTAFKNAAAGQDKFLAGANLVSAGIGGLVGLVDIFTSSAKARKDAEQAYYDAVITSQNQYNLSLIDQLRLQEQLKGNLFLKDYKADILAASTALSKANADYSASLKLLFEQGQAKVGQRDKVDGKTLVGGVASGAVAGAAIGALVGGGVLSIPAAAAGAIIGSVVGFVSGLFGGKKKVDTFGPLIAEYPELIKSTGEFNTALAENLIQNNLVSDSTKILLQNTLDLNKARQASIDQINQDIKDLAGSLGDDLRSSLVQAFRDGTDAAQAFGDSVSKVIENIISQFLFQEIFGSEFDKLSADLKASFGITGDQNATDDLTDFFKTAGPLVQIFNDSLKAAQEAGKANGLNLFSPTNGGGTQPGLTNDVKAITEDTAGLLVGQFNGQRVATLQLVQEQTAANAINKLIYALSVYNLAALEKIQINTLRTADNTETLKDIKGSLASIDSKVDSSANALAANGRK